MVSDIEKYTIEVTSKGFEITPLVLDRILRDLIHHQVAVIEMRDGVPVVTTSEHIYD